VRSAQSKRSATSRPPSQPDVTIVGVGASAGGLEAFSQLLRGLPADAGLAVVFVQHLSPQHDSALVPLLSSQTSMPVIQVSEGMRVEADHVYVIPPNVHMAISGEELHLRPRPDDRTQYTPVDSFFSSLAEAARARAIGVVLSGTASDGAQGIREIKAAGGITIAQAPETAKHDGMPRAAIATGMVDLVLAPSAMGRHLNQLSRRAYAETVEPTDLPLDDAELQRVFEMLRQASDIDFRHYKTPTMKRRLLRRMALHRLSDTASYIRLLETDPAELRGLYQDLLIHVTRFFREPESFEAITEHVFPALMEGRQPDHPIRVWVSGCATGEEAYSVAIVMTEFLQRLQGDTRVQIFATDVSESAIEYARTGVYPRNVEADIATDRLRRFFVNNDTGYRVSRMIRDMCVFARQDLTKDPPFSHLDLILCRNVLIYMDAVLQKRLLSVFHYALNPNGFLVLGQAESVGAQGTLFSMVDKKFRIHRKKVVSTPASMPFPVDYAVASQQRLRVSVEAGSANNALESEVNRIIMDRYAPPGVVVDQDMQIVQFRGQTGAFLEPAPGEASLNLLKMTREGLLHGLRAALQNARKSRNVVRKDGLQVRLGNAWRPVSIEVVPLSSSGRSHDLVLFDDSTERAPVAHAPITAKPSAKPQSSKRDQAHQVDLLQRELAASREYLQSIIQELEAANEELQSANEEILSSNEELQSTNEELDTAKEELQSTNEELNTLNEELHGRNEELSRVNSDLVNLVGSVQIAIVIVSSDLRIRRFTPMAEKVMNLIPSDLDRSIGHINPNIDCPNLEQLITECIDTVSPVEREVRDRSGRWYSLRIRPYKNIDNRIDGAVVALFDIDAPKRFEASVRVATELADSILHAAARPMAVLESDLRVRLANGAFARLFAHDGELRGRPLQEVSPGLGGDDLTRRLSSTDGSDSEFRVDLPVNGPDGRRDGLSVRFRRFTWFDGNTPLILLVIEDGGSTTASPVQV
jgi:two-component system CheB/CheR fusion protein